ncbi:MAG: efflux RND transporter periplasmic adaptor subunit, partial [Terriglobia bacterium]
HDLRRATPRGGRNKESAMKKTTNSQRIIPARYAAGRGHPLARFAGRQRLTKAAALLALACLPVLALSGCSHSSVSVDAASPQASPSGSAATQPSYFTVPEGQMAHLQLVKITASNLPRVLQLPGSVTYNEFETTPVITQVSGPVARVLVVPGETVQAGQPMLEVTSPEYAQMRDNFIKARDSFNLAKTNLRRARDLYAHEAISTSALQQAQSTLVQAQADMTAAWQALKVIGLSSQKQVLQTAVSPEISLLAPISGQVVERTVSPGQVLQGGATQCFMISNMNRVWVLANVYQNDLAAIHQGDEVSIETNAYTEAFRGRISYIAPAMDPATRTLQVRIVTQNPGQKLKKGMYVTVLVSAGAIQNALTVPDSAVLRNSENSPFVYIAVGPRQFAQRLVAIGETQGGKTQVLSGLQPGEQVVADGSLFLQFANSFQH